MLNRSLHKCVRREMNVEGMVRELRGVPNFQFSFSAFSRRFHRATLSHAHATNLSDGAVARLAAS